MLFGYIYARDEVYSDDVLSSEASLECFAFDRPLLLDSELHVAGAMAFATTFGFAGMSLIEWALLQTLDSAAYRLLPRSKITSTSG
jgi:hypothetical protein